MAATSVETKNEGHCGGGRHRHGPPTEEQRQQFEAEFKQAFLDEYKKRFGDQLISADQTWELYQAIQEQWHAKKKERRHSPPGQHHGPPPPEGAPGHHWPPPDFEEKRKQITAELQQDFQSNFTAAHGSNKINADQAWSLIQQIKQKKREKWKYNRPKHWPHHHGPGGHRRHSPPNNQ